MTFNNVHTPSLSTIVQVRWFDEQKRSNQAIRRCSSVFRYAENNSTEFFPKIYGPSVLYC